MILPFAKEVFHVVIISTLFVVLKGQTVTVSLEDVSSNPVEETAVLRCDFAVDDPSYAFFNLEWRFGTMLLADFYNRATSPDYYGFCSTPGRCNCTRTDSYGDLVLSSLEFPGDQGTYGCTVTYDLGAQIPSGEDTATLTVVVTGTIGLFNASGDSFGNNSKVKLSSDVSEHILTCEVQDANPGATFTWTLGGEPVAPELISDTVHDVGMDGLTTSSSNVTLEPMQTYNGKKLQCKAVNYEDDPGEMISVTLNVDDPCDTYPCENGGTCKVGDDGVTPECVCIEGFIGELCQDKGGASSVLYRLDVILTCLAMTAAYLNNHVL